MVEIVLNKILLKLSHGRLTYQDAESAVLRYKALERQVNETIQQINHPEVKKKLAQEIMYKFENGESFTLEEWNQWRKEGWGKVFEELKRRGRK
jgi:hypothetical protein